MVKTVPDAGVMVEVSERVALARSTLPLLQTTIWSYSVSAVVPCKSICTVFPELKSKKFVCIIPGLFIPGARTLAPVCAKMYPTLAIDPP